jgi:hypothetical protein
VLSCIEGHLFQNRDLGLGQALAAYPGPRRRMGKLNMIILRPTEPADVVAPRRLSKNQKAAGRAGIRLRLHVLPRSDTGSQAALTISVEHSSFINGIELHRLAAFSVSALRVG